MSSWSSSVLFVGCCVLECGKGCYEATMADDRQERDDQPSSKSLLSSGKALCKSSDYWKAQLPFFLTIWSGVRGLFCVGLRKGCDDDDERKARDDQSTSKSLISWRTAADDPSKTRRSIAFIVLYDMRWCCGLQCEKG